MYENLLKASSLQMVSRDRIPFLIWGFFIFLVSVKSNQIKYAECIYRNKI